MADPTSLFYILAVGRITSHVLFNSMLLQRRRLSTWTIFTTLLFTGKLLGWVKKHQEGISWNLSQHVINGLPQNCVSSLWWSLHSPDESPFCCDLLTLTGSAVRCEPDALNRCCNKVNVKEETDGATEHYICWIPVTSGQLCRNGSAWNKVCPAWKWRRTHSTWITEQSRL